MRRLVKRSRQLRSRNSVKAFQVGLRSMLDLRFPTDTRPSLSEEFSIYLNYVRKLGFEETPDYDFLRELFAKVMKNNGYTDDQVYAWNLIKGTPSCFLFRLLPSPHAQRLFTGGRGWESAASQYNQTLQQTQNTLQNTQSPRKLDPTQTSPVPPSPALVRHDSKKGQSPGILLPPNNSQGGPGNLTPLSGVAQINVSIIPNRPPGQQNSYDYREESYLGDRTYDRASPMVSTIQNVPAPLNANRPGGLQNGGIPEQEENEPPGVSLWKILTCKCS